MDWTGEGCRVSRSITEPVIDPVCASASETASANIAATAASVNLGILCMRHLTTIGWKG